MTQDLENQLIAIRRGILSMGASVESRVSQALDAFLSRDAELATPVRSSDDEIDRMDIDIEAECQRVLALSQPVAKDLRLVLAVLRINTDLERVGDLAKNIAKRVLDLKDLPPLELPPATTTMATRAKRMLSDSLGSFADEDVELARKVLAADQIVDDIQKELFVWAQETIPQHVEWTNAVIDVLSVVRAIERIADHASNIAEDVIYMIEGEVIRHAHS